MECGLFNTPSLIPSEWKHLPVSAASAERRSPGCLFRRGGIMDSVRENKRGDTTSEGLKQMPEEETLAGKLAVAFKSFNQCAVQREDEWLCQPSLLSAVLSVCTLGVSLPRQVQTRVLNCIFERRWWREECACKCSVKDEASLANYATCRCSHQLSSMRTGDYFVSKVSCFHHKGGIAMETHKTSQVSRVRDFDFDCQFDLRLVWQRRFSFVRAAANASIGCPLR